MNYKMNGIHHKIFLLGFMGSGKSTVGRALSEISGWKVIDTDHEIEKQENMTIAELFHLKGEKYFRKAEADWLRSLKNTENMIVATGGGMPTYGNNMSYINEQGKSFYLKVGIDELCRRLEEDHHRPLLSGQDKRPFIRQKLKERTLVYEQSNFQVVGNRDPKLVAKRIWRLYSKEVSL